MKLRSVALRGGFTLIELLSCCALLTILLALGASFFAQESAEAKLRRGEQMLLAELERACIKAAVLGEPVALLVQVEEGASAAQEPQAWRRFVLASQSVKQDDLAQEPQGGVWQADSNWQLLPQGVLFGSLENGALEVSSLLDEGLAVELSAGKSQLVEARGLVFGLRGSVVELGQKENHRKQLAQTGDGGGASLPSFTLCNATLDDSGELQWGRGKGTMKIVVEPTTGRTRALFVAKGD